MCPTLLPGAAVSFIVLERAYTRGRASTTRSPVSRHDEFNRDVMQWITKEASITCVADHSSLPAKLIAVTIIALQKYINVSAGFPSVIMRLSWRASVFFSLSRWAILNF